MRTRIVEMAVGAFILVSIVSFAILALQVSGLQSSFREEKGYQVRVEFNNIGGLKLRSKVTLAGVLVGRVTHIELDPETFNAKVDVRVSHRFNQIPEDSRASILTAGLLGDNYIGLQPGFSETVLKEGSEIPVENTDSAIVLEQLVEKFVGQKATESTDKKGDSDED